jgi:hypothetical protein
MAARTDENADVICRGLQHCELFLGALQIVNTQTR